MYTLYIYNLEKLHVVTTDRIIYILYKWYMKLLNYIEIYICVNVWIAPWTNQVIDTVDWEMFISFLYSHKLW